eukprot:tig00000622_g2624.t1
MSDAEEAPKDVIAQFIDQVKDLRRWVVEQASRPNRQRQPWPVLELARAGWLDSHYNYGGASYVRSHDEGRIIDEFKRIWFALGSKLSILSTLRTTFACKSSSVDYYQRELNLRERQVDYRPSLIPMEGTVQNIIDNTYNVAVRWRKAAADLVKGNYRDLANEDNPVGEYMELASGSIVPRRRPPWPHPDLEWGPSHFGQ